jgi:hypothetical protein
MAVMRAHPRSSASSTRRPLRLALVLTLVALLAATCIRFAIVAAGAESSTGLAWSLWPGHPKVLQTKIMLGLAQAAVERQALSPATNQQVKMLSERAPLSPDPFAVEAAVALRGGLYQRAEELLIAARQRDPRDRAVRLLLADTDLRQGKIEPALQELVVLGRLSPDIHASITAMLSQYAHSPGAVPRLRAALALSAPIENELLLQLADDPKNTELILSLATRVHGTDGLLDWQQKLLSSLVQAREFRTAFGLWERFSNETGDALGNFADSRVASPFTWKLAQGGDGVANANGNALSVDFFGTRDVSLASKVILLPPGNYDLRFRLIGPTSDPSSVHWLLTCLGGQRQLADSRLPKSPGLVSVRFNVPSGCEAQRLELKGFSQVYPAEVALSFSDVELGKLP